MMKSNNFINNKIFVVITLSVLVFSFAVFSKAQTTNSPKTNNYFVLEPGKVEVFANPGESVMKSITVTNNAPSTVSFKVEVEDFTGSDNKDMPVVLLGNEKSPYSFKDNIIPDKNSFTLDTNSSITIPIRINIPLNAQPGGFYSSVLVSNEPTIDSESQTGDVEGKTKIISRVGTLFFVRVNGVAKESGSLQDVVVIPREKDETSYKFNILFKNDGNVHLVPFGWMTISNIFGKTVAKIPIDAYFSMPNSIRYREITWNPTFLFGKYYSTVELNKGYGSNLIDTKTISFWVIPWKVTVGFLVVVLGILLFFRKFKLSVR